MVDLKTRRKKVCKKQWQQYGIGKITPAETARVTLLKKLQSPNATELSKPTLEICEAYIAGKIDMSAPKLAPDSPHIIKNGKISPELRKEVKPNVTTASSIPIDKSCLNS